MSGDKQLDQIGAFAARFFGLLYTRLRSPRCYFAVALVDNLGRLMGAQ
jgi:hypothetical protein